MNLAVDTTPTTVILENNIFDDVTFVGTKLALANLTSNLTVPGLPASTGPDTNNGNVVVSDGSPITITRWSP